MKRQQCVSNVTAQVEEAYSGRVIIKAFNREESSSENMHKATEELAEATKKADFMINAINPAIRLINRFGQVLIAVLAGKMLLEGRLTVGVFQAFFPVCESGFGAAHGSCLHDKQYAVRFSFPGTDL